MVQPSPPLVLPEEADVLARVAGMDLDLQAMAVGANLWRAAQAMRSVLERTVLRPRGLSFTGFSMLFNLWVWDAMQTRALAESMNCTRATVSSVSDTLERRGLVRRAGQAHDRRLVQLALTADGRALIEDVFPRFNAGEAELVRDLDEHERQALAGLLRRLVVAMRAGRS